MKTIITAALSLLLLSGCVRTWRWFIFSEGTLCCGGELAWVNMPRGQASLDDAGLAYIQVTNELKGVQRALKRAEEEWPRRHTERGQKTLARLREAIALAEARQRDVRAVGDGWEACERANPQSTARYGQRCNKSGDWLTAQKAYMRAVEAASLFSARTYWYEPTEWQKRQNRNSDRK